MVRVERMRILKRVCPNYPVRVTRKAPDGVRELAVPNEK